MGRETRDTIGRLNPETGAPTLILQEIEFLEEKKTENHPAENCRSSKVGMQLLFSWNFIINYFWREGGDGSIKEFMSNKDEFIR